MTHEESWNAFIDELRAYVLEHHHFPNKHTNLLSRVKYVRKKIKDGTLENRKKEMFLEVANMRDLEEHTGGRKKKEKDKNETRQTIIRRNSQEGGREPSASHEL